MDLTPQSADTAVSADLSGAVALAGMLLVFFGYLYTQVNSVMSDQREKHYRIWGRLGLILFFASLGLDAAATAYWLSPSVRFADGLLVASMLLAILIAVRHNLREQAPRGFHRPS